MKVLKRIGRIPSWAHKVIAKISLIRRGSRGRYLMILGKKRIIDKVAANVSWKPAEKRLKGLTRRRKKALAERVLSRGALFQISFAVR